MKLRGGSGTGERALRSGSLKLYRPKKNSKSRVELTFLKRLDFNVYTVGKTRGNER